jgi:hypothetical protein
MFQVQSATLPPASSSASPEEKLPLSRFGEGRGLNGAQRLNVLNVLNDLNQQPYPARTLNFGPGTLNNHSSSAINKEI